MPQVRFTSHLERFFPGLSECAVQAQTVAEIVGELEAAIPGLSAYLVDEQGSLRHHVNIFVGDRPVSDRRTLSDAVAPDETVHVMQALSGG